MIIQSSGAAAPAWPSLGDLALYGLITTLLAALAGVGVQLWISRRGARDAERLRRHNELIAIYSDIGVYMSASVSALARMIRFDAEGNVNLLTAMQHGKRVLKAHEAWMIENQPGHKIRLLTLHRASQEVINAYELWSKAIELHPPKFVSNADAKSWFDERIKASSDATKEFYRTAGLDAETALKGK